MKTAIITVGISASGKSTWAEKFVKDKKDWSLLCRDNVRRQILESKYDRELLPGELWKLWKFKDENEVSAIVETELKSAVEKNRNVIFADTNLNKDRRDQLQKKLESLGYEVEIKRFDIDFDEALKRDRMRGDSVGYQVLYKQYIQWNDEFGVKYIADKKLPPAILCDIDGTLAHMTGRGPFEWDKVDEDKIDKLVFAMIDTYLHEYGYTIIILSGRDGCARTKTEKWLQANFVKYDKLYMRAPSDMRKDSVVKEEIFWREIAKKYNVLAAIDDRPQMVRKWLELGIKTISVGNPYLEF